MTDDRQETLRFIDMHRPALERDEARHNLILSLFDRFLNDDAMPLAAWPLGAPGACAIRGGTHNIVLGDVNQEECAALAQEVHDLDYPGVIGPDDTAAIFAEAAAAHGHRFAERVPQMIHTLQGPPRYPGASGRARQMTKSDADLLYEWTCAYIAEAVPHDRLPTREAMDSPAASGRYSVWEDGGTPVSMAAIIRETRETAMIAMVYTPPGVRGRGYAGSATAAVCEEIFAKGKTTAGLYTDLRNPASNRCYAKIGFAPLCSSLFYPRLGG